MDVNYLPRKIGSQQRLSTIPQHTVTPRLPLPSPTRYSFSYGELHNVLFRQRDVKVVNIEDIKLKLSPNNIEKVKEVANCEICRGEPKGDCLLHGPTFFKREPLVANAGHKDLRLTYAISSFPDEVQLCMSSVTGAGYGVSAKQHIPIGTWIGPYEGRRIRPEDVTPDTDTTYMWEIFQDGKLVCYLDASDENTSSWMRFIRCARYREEQNLYSFQYCGNIYYRAFRDISIGQELLVWYDDKYQQYMGIPLNMQDMAIVDPNGNKLLFDLLAYHNKSPSSSQQKDQLGAPQTSVTHTPPVNAPQNIQLAIAQPILANVTQPMPPNVTQTIPINVTQPQPVTVPPHMVPITQHHLLPVAHIPVNVAQHLPVNVTQPITVAVSQQIPIAGTKVFPVPVTQHVTQSLPTTATQPFPAAVTQPINNSALSPMRRHHLSASRDQNLPPLKELRHLQMAHGTHVRANHVTNHVRNLAGIPDAGRLSEHHDKNALISMEQKLKEITNESNYVDEDYFFEFSDCADMTLWKCGQCKKSFAQRALLQIHVCPGMPNRPYKCGHCSEAFSQSNELRTHVVTHTNEKPFKCGYCSRSFAGATTLNNHIRTHTGEKPFYCEKCGKNFSQASQLSRHQRFPTECMMN